MHCAGCNINSRSVRMKYHKPIPAGLDSLPYHSTENTRLCLACHRKLTKKPILKRQLSKVEEEPAVENNDSMELELDDFPPLPEEKDEEAAGPKKRKAYDTEDADRYKKKMKEIGIRAEEWTEFDMVKIDANGCFRCNSWSNESEFTFLFKQHIDKFFLPGTQLSKERKQALELALKHVIAKSANTVSQMVVYSLGLNKQII